MPVDREKVLRDFAVRAMEVEALIDQGDGHVRGFQNTQVGNSPDNEIECIQIKLEEIAGAIEAYLSRRGGTL